MPRVAIGDFYLPKLIGKSRSTGQKGEARFILLKAEATAEGLKKIAQAINDTPGETITVSFAGCKTTSSSLVALPRVQLAVVIPSIWATWARGWPMVCPSITA